MLTSHRDSVDDRLCPCPFPRCTHASIAGLDLIGQGEEQHEAGCLHIHIHCMAPCRVPAPKAVLLYGAPGSGKTMLAHAIAHESGGRLFNISPRLTDGKYPGKAATMLMHIVSPSHLFRELYKTLPEEEPRAEVRTHMNIYITACTGQPADSAMYPASSRHALSVNPIAQVFKVAKALGPSVIYLDDTEKVRTPKSHCCHSVQSPCCTSLQLYDARKELLKY